MNSDENFESNKQTFFSSYFLAFFVLVVDLLFISSNSICILSIGAYQNSKLLSLLNNKFILNMICFPLIVTRSLPQGV